MAKDKWILICTMILLFGIQSCYKSGNVDTSQSDYTDIDDPVHNVLINFCSSKKVKKDNIDSVVKVIVQNSRLVTIESMRDEDCVISFIQSIAKNTNPEDLQALEILASHSDGAISEYIIDVAVFLIEERTIQFLNFLELHENSALFQALVDGLSMKLSVEKIEKANLKATISLRLSNVQQIRTLDVIFAKVSAKKFD